MLYMARKDLSCLLEKIIGENTGEHSVRAEYDKSGELSLLLDCKEGIVTFEFFSAAPINDEYTIHYLAMLDNACDTLSRYNDLADSFVSPISNWSDNAKKQRIDGSRELYNAEKGGLYRPFVSYNASFLSYEDVERAFDFFYKVFKEKGSARKLQNMTDIPSSHNIRA